MLSIFRQIIFVICILSIVCAKLSKDAYKILGVSKNCSQADIKKAYHSLAAQLHPDNNDNQSEAFMELTEAYEYLKTPESRQKYDQYGEDDPKQNQNYHHTSRNQHEMGGFPFDFEEIFFGMGNGGQFGWSGSRQKRSSPPTRIFKESSVVEINENEINKREGEILICFYNQNLHTQTSFIKDYKKLAQDLQPLLKVGAVNCDEMAKLCNLYEVQKSPTIILLGPPDVASTKIYKNKNQQPIYNYEKLLKWTKKNSHFEATPLDKFNLNKWLNNDPEKPKLILFSKQQPSMEFKSAVYKFREKIKFGYIKQTNSPLLKQFYTQQNFPSILFLKDYDKLSGKTVECNMDIEISVIKMLTEVLNEKRSEYQKYGKLTTYSELTKRRVESGECGPTDSQLCIIHLHNNSKNSKILDKYLLELSEKYKYDPIKFVFVNIKQQKYFLDSFDTSFISPLTSYLIALRPKRQKYKIFDCNVTQTSQVDKMVEKLLTGGMTIDTKLRHPIQLIPPSVSSRDEL